VYLVYVGPHDAVEVAPNGHAGEAFTAERLVPLEVPEDLAALLLEQADWDVPHGPADLAALATAATVPNPPVED